DRQPLAPDRAPPVPRPAVQPVRRDRAEGAGPLRPLRPRLLRPAVPAAGLLRVAQGGPAVAAQRLARPDQRTQPAHPAQAALPDVDGQPPSPARPTSPDGSGAAPLRRRCLRLPSLPSSGSPVSRGSR